VWKLRQLVGTRNRAASSSTRLLVTHWLGCVNENPQIQVERLKDACLAAIAPPARRIA
jgi:hypothetical protein